MKYYIGVDGGGTKTAFALFNENKEMLEYKAEEIGVVVKFVPKGTPTTQTCSCCGHRLEGEDKLGLNVRRYVCPSCGQDIDRDVNAAINVFKLPIG